MFAELDHQLTLDPGGRNCRELYAAAREDSPLVKDAAGCLLEACESGGEILVSTGFPILPVAQPETDGPLGAAVLARGLSRLGGTPIIVGEPMVHEPMTAVAEALGMEVPEIETVDPAAASVEGILDRDDISAAVAIERPGRCGDGSYRTMAGDDISPLVGPVETLFEAAGDRGIPTVAVGDGGNEIGMGAVRSAVETHVTHGETIACVRSVDHLVVAGVSNWGAYGIVAALSLLTGEQLLHSGGTERDLLAASLDAGCVDGVSGESELSVDGVASGVHEGVVDVLAESCGVALEGS